MRQSIIALGLVWVLGAGALGIQSACTPAQRADARTALQVSQCVNAIALRHLDSGADLKDIEANAVLASEIALECGLPLLGEPQKAAE